MKNQLIAKIKIGQKQLGWDDNTYRDVLRRITGKDSCAKCNFEQMEDVIQYMKEAGAKFTKKRKVKKADCPQIRYIHVLWQNLYSAKVVKEPRPDDFARKIILQKFKNAHVPSLIEWIKEPAHKSHVIEVLKAKCDQNEINRKL